CFGGSFTESLQIGSGMGTTPAGSNSPFVAKEGNWMVGSTSATTGTDVLETKSVTVRQNDDYVFATGQLSHPVLFGNMMVGVAGADQAFVIRMDPSTGSIFWAFIYGDGSKGVHGNGIAVDAVLGGPEFVVGDFSGTITIDTAPLTSEGTGPDTFVTKLDTGGKVLWAKAFGGPDT